MSFRAGSVRVIVAAALVGAGWVCWSAGRMEGRLAAASDQIAVLQYGNSLSEYEGVEQSMGLLRWLPASVRDLLGNLGARRAVAAYWDKRYGLLPLARDASGELIETNPDVLLLAANAAYRTGVRAGARPVDTVRALDTVISNYAEVLRKAPGHVDAAYNYEYAVRMRAAVAGGEGLPGPKPAGAAPKSGGQLAAGDGSARRYDLPAGPTIHGQPGEPPPDTDMNKFKMLIPRQPDEQEAAPDKAGEGGRPVRRG